MVQARVSPKWKLFRNKSNYSRNFAKEQSNQEIKGEYNWVCAFQYKSDNTVNMEIYHLFQMSIFLKKLFDITRK